MNVLGRAIREYLSLIFDAWIKPTVEQVGGKVCEDDGHRNDEEDALHQRIVAAVDGVEECLADALIDENRLNQQRTTDDKTDTEGQLRKKWQRGITSNIGGCDAPIA